MEPNVERSPALALPQPSGEQGTASNVAYRGAEAPPARPEAAPQQPVAPAMQGAVVPVAAPQLMAGGAAQDASTTQAAAAATDDMGTNALDEEWINKAKVIIEQTKSDPYVESREISKTKADYLKIRYNKHIKVAEDTTR